LGPKILLSTLFSKTLNLHFSLHVCDKISQPYKTTCRTAVSKSRMSSLVRAVYQIVVYLCISLCPIYQIYLQFCNYQQYWRRGFKIRALWKYHYLLKLIFFTRTSLDISPFWVSVSWYKIQRCHCLTACYAQFCS
jgi:hypothetical protein